MDAWMSDPIRRKGWTNVMKKILSLLLCLAMLLTLGLTAMGQAEDGGELRVSLCIAETLGDLGFYDSANEGLKRLEADYGVIGSVVECKSDASMYQVALVEAARAERRGGGRGLAVLGWADCGCARNARYQVYLRG